MRSGRRGDLHRVTYTPSGVTVPYAMAKVCSTSFAWTTAPLRPRAMRTRVSMVGAMAGENGKVMRGEGVLLPRRLRATPQQ
jgi:hypothetical protein